MSWVLSRKQPDLWPHAHPCEFPNDLWAYPVSSGVAQEESTETRGSRGRIRMHRMQLDATWCLYQEKFGSVQVIKIKPMLLIGIRRLYARVHEILFVSEKKTHKGYWHWCLLPWASWPLCWLDALAWKWQEPRWKSNMQVIEINQTQYEHRHIFTALENAGISRAWNILWFQIYARM